MISGHAIPPDPSYGMEYKQTSSTDPKQVVFMGIKVHVREGRVHTTVFDREEHYRAISARGYSGSTTTIQQYGEVLMGRYVASKNPWAVSFDLQSAGSTHLTSGSRCGNASYASAGRPVTFE